MNKVKPKYLFLTCLFFPVLILLGIVFYNIILIYTSPKVLVPIVAYDPRSFLSGHYLVFNLTDAKYTTTFKCQTGKLTTQPKIACWQNLATGWQVSLLDERQDTKACQILLKGTCSRNSFYTTPMQFYIPEAYVEKIGDAVNDHRASIELLIKNNNELTPVQLFIDGKPWREVIIH